MSAPHVAIMIGDCREMMRDLPEKSVQTVITSPPYWALRDYGVDGQIGMEETVDDFLTAMVEVFRDVHRVLRDDGTCWMNLGDTYCTTSSSGNTALGIKPKDLIGIPWRTALALQADGWYLRQDIIWHKPNPVPEPNRGRCTIAHEYMFLLTKSERYYYDNDAIREPSGDEVDWDAGTVVPARTVIPCVVLDPFGGTGTTGEVALQHRRSAILIDLDPRNEAFMRGRLDKVQPSIEAFTSGRLDVVQMRLGVEV